MLSNINQPGHEPKLYASINPNAGCLYMLYIITTLTYILVHALYITTLKYTLVQVTYISTLTYILVHVTYITTLTYILVHAL